MKTTDTIAALKDVAGKIEGLRIAHGMSKATLINEYPLLGDKAGGAYYAALRGVMAKRNPVTMLANFTNVLAALETRKTGVVDPLYADLPHVADFLANVDSLANQRGLKRLIIVRGASGEGKSSLLKLVERERPGKVLRMTASVGWRSFHAALGDMLKAMGTPEVTALDDKEGRNLGLDRLIGCAARSAVLRQRLLDARRIVCLDEMQSVDPDFLTFLKDCINAAAESGSGLCFIIAAQDALWKKLSREAPEEMRQLRHNRLYLEYQMPGAEPAAAAQFLAARLNTRTPLTEAAAALIAMAQGLGRNPAVGVWAFLRNVADVVNELGAPPTNQLLIESAESVYYDMTGKRAKEQTGGFEP